MRRGTPAPWRIATGLFLLTVLGHAWFVGAIGWNQSARLAATFTFVEPGPGRFTLRIDEFVEGDSRGMATGDWARGADGHYYSNKAPGVSLIGVPFYALIFAVERRLGIEPLAPGVTRWNSILLNLPCSVAFTAAATVLLFLHLGAVGFATREALLGSLAYAFGTLVFPFDTSLWGHTTAAACVLGALCLAWWPGGMRWPPLAGALGSLAVLVEYTAALPFAAAAAPLALPGTRWRQRIAFAAGALPPLAILLLYHQLAFGDYLATATSRGNPVFRDPEGAFGGVLGGILPDALFGLTFSAWRGLFLFCPVLLFSALGAWQQWRAGRRALVGACLAAFAASLLLVASFNAWWGGWANGARYLIVTLPLFAILAPRLAALSLRVRAAYVAALLLSIFNMLTLSAVELMLDPMEKNPLYGLSYRLLVTGEYPASADATNLARMLGLGPPWDLALFALLLGGGALSLLRSTRAATPRSS
jgi:hypothetical protein